MPEWIDLLDPSPEELRRHLPKDIHPRALEQLLADAKHDDEPRPKLEGHGNYIFGVFLVPVLVPNEDRIYYQEVDLVGMREGLLTVRKTPERGKPFDISPAKAACRPDEVVGMNAYHLIDEIAERYLDLIDGLNNEIARQLEAVHGAQELVVGGGEVQFDLSCHHGPAVVELDPVVDDPSYCIAHRR